MGLSDKDTDSDDLWEVELADDNLIRYTMIGAFIAFMPFAVYFRIRSRTSEKLDRWQEGPCILFGLRIGAIPGFVGWIAWMIDPQWMAWSSLPIPSWLRWVGLALLMCVGIVIIWTFRSLRGNLTDTVVTRRDHFLVTTGPYRFVRHPFYLSFAIVVLAISLVTANWFILLTGAIPFAFIVARTRIEEEKLVERFGDDYRDYMRRVGRFVPRLRSSNDPRTASLDRNGD